VMSSVGIDVRVSRKEQKNWKQKWGEASVYDYLAVASMLERGGGEKRSICIKLSPSLLSSLPLVHSQSGVGSGTLGPLWYVPRAWSHQRGSR
jgi:hypothetical protein